MPRKIGGVEVPTIFDLAQGPAGWPHGRSEADRAWSLSLERRDAVIRAAPDSGLAESWSLIETLALRTVRPISMVSLTPTAAPFPDSQTAVDWFEEHPGDGAAICMGDQGGWVLLGVHVRRWADWVRWLRSDDCCDVIQTIEGNYDRPAARRIGRPLGDVTQVTWATRPPADTQTMGVRTFPATRGHRAGQQAALAALKSITAGPDGGWLIWPVRAIAGRLPSFRQRPIAEGVSVLPDGFPVPVAGVRDGERLQTSGRVLGRPDDTATAWLPSWLLGRFGGKLS